MVLRRLLLGCGLASMLGCNTALISLFPADGGPRAGSSDTGAPSAGAPDAGEPDAGTELLPGLVSEWQLESDPSDSAGGNNGQLLGGAAFAEDNARGQVLSCNGTDAGVRLANTAGLSFSYAAWI